RQTLETAKVGDYRDLYFSQAEAGIGRAQTNIARRDQIEPAAYAPAADGGDYRFAASGEVVERFLHVANQVEQARAFRSEILSRAEVPPKITHHRGEIEPVAEVVTFASNDDRANLFVAIERREDFRHLAPEVRPHGVAFAGSDQHYFYDAFVLLQPK